MFGTFNERLRLYGAAYAVLAEILFAQGLVMMALGLTPLYSWPLRLLMVAFCLAMTLGAFSGRWDRPQEPAAVKIVDFIEWFKRAW